MANVNKVEVRLSEVMLSFAQIFEPKSFNDSKPAYSANLVISKDDDQVAEIKNAIKQLIEVTWPKGDVKLKADKIAFKDGDEVTYQGYENSYFISSRNYRAPKLKDEYLDDVTANDDKLQSGDYVNAVIEFWVQDNNYGRRINCNLVALQHVKKGERFGGNSSGDMFTALAQKVEENDNPFDAVAPKLKFGKRD